jgi:pimeloyl-ACP methyl ester carboxylesterase
VDERWGTFDRDGTRLAWLDAGGHGPPVLLLHGLAGYVGEWRDTAQALTHHHRVIALEQRGHGRSERLPRDLARSAYVSDAVALLEHLQLGPTALVGQSLGGHTAFLVAARRPDLVSALVVAEASAGGPAEQVPEQVRKALTAWPVPFASRQAALDHFGGDTPKGRAWADGLENRSDGWWPRFDLEVMVASLAEIATRSYWNEWQQIQCPTFLVTATRSDIPKSDTLAMVDQLQSAQLVELPDTGHDLHLEQPDLWKKTISDFLAEPTTGPSHPA